MGGDKSTHFLFDNETREQVTPAMNFGSHLIKFKNGKGADKSIEEATLRFVKDSGLSDKVYVYKCTYTDMWLIRTGYAKTEFQSDYEDSIAAVGLYKL